MNINEHIILAKDYQIVCFLYWSNGEGEARHLKWYTKRCLLKEQHRTIWKQRAFKRTVKKARNLHQSYPFFNRRKTRHHWSGRILLITTWQVKDKSTL